MKENIQFLQKNMQFLHQILHLKRPNIKMLDLMIYMILNCFCFCPVYSVSVLVLPEIFLSRNFKVSCSSFSMQVSERVEISTVTYEKYAKTLIGVIIRVG